MVEHIYKKEKEYYPEPEEIRILIPAMEEVARIALRHREQGVTEDIKTGKHDIATIADREIEDYLRAYIEEHSKSFPNAYILGEESGGEGGKKTITLDGIDGTACFARGFEEGWAITVSEVEDEQVNWSIISCPGVNKLYWAKRNAGAYLIEKKIIDERIVHTTRKLKVSGETDFEKAYINLSQDIVKGDDKFAFNGSELERRFRKLARLNIATASSAYTYGLLGEGLIDVAIHPAQPIWDIAPGIVLVKEAGGKFTNWDGQEEFEITRERANNIIASNGLLHEPALQLLRQPRRRYWMWY